MQIAKVDTVVCHPPGASYQIGFWSRMREGSRNKMFGHVFFSSRQWTKCTRAVRMVQQWHDCAKRSKVSAHDSQHENPNVSGNVNPNVVQEQGFLGPLKRGLKQCNSARSNRWRSCRQLVLPTPVSSCHRRIEVCGVWWMVKKSETATPVRVLFAVACDKNEATMYQIC